jgi:hypothetical protein
MYANDIKEILKLYYFNPLFHTSFAKKQLFAC